MLLPTEQLLQLAIGATGVLALPINLKFEAGLCPGPWLLALQTWPFGATAGRLCCSCALVVMNSSTVDAVLQ